MDNMDNWLSNDGMFEREAIVRALRSQLLESLGSIEKEMVEDLRSRLTTPYPPASVPGEYPHYRKGDLYRSIGGSAQPDGDDIVLTLGSEVSVENPEGKIQWLESNRLLLQPTVDEWARKLKARIADETGLME